MIMNKKLTGVALMCLSLLVSSVASAKAKFYFNVCVDTSESVANGGLKLDPMGVHLVAPLLYRQGVTEPLTATNQLIPSCQYGLFRGFMAEVPEKAHYANWKLNDGQYVPGAVIVFNLSDLSFGYTSSSGVWYGLFKGSCGDVRIQLPFYLTSLTGDWRNFTPDGPNGLIKIKITARQDKTLSCTAVH